MEGYLSRRSGRLITGTKKKHWYYVRDNQICYRRSQNRDASEQAVLLEGDLRLCMVRPMTKKSSFEVISPSKSTVLEAASEDVAKAWIKSIQESIKSAISQTVEGTYSTGISATQVAEKSKVDEEDEREAGKNIAKQESTKINVDR